MLSGCSTRPVVSPPLPSSFLGSTKAFLSSFSFPGVNRCPVLSVNRKVRKYGAISRFNSEEDTPPDPKTSVLALILGGGKGTRLYPLTKSRAKPAVPLGANYRLIDIPVSNCINSDITKIYVLTQFNSTSLNSHIYRAYSGNMVGFRDDSFVEVLAAEQTLENQFWFQGTADAVRQYLWLFEDPTVKEFLILAGDHLYRMDYQVFIKHHRRSKADITVAAVPVSEDKATSLGLMKINPEGDIIEFAEKPEGSALKAMKVDTTILGLDDGKAKEMPYIASMGIYVISKEVMMDLLLKKFPDANDFGSQIIPGATEVGMKKNNLYNG